MKTKILLIAMLFFSYLTAKAVDLPIDFESGTFTFTDFDGGVVTVIDNPQSTGLNTSTKTAQMVKNAGQTWGGSWFALDNPIDFSTNKKFKMKVFSPKVGAKVLLKVENMDNAGINFEKEVETTVANSWEELVFDYSLIDATKSFQKIIIIFENGTMGDGSANFTYLFDDIELFSDGSVVVPPSLPIDFESTTVTYGFVDFDGGVATIIPNPQIGGENTSATVAQIVRDGGATWGGSKIILDKDIDFSAGSTFSMKVYSARAGVPVLFKLEGTAQTEVSTNTTVANEWETLTWDFTGQPSGTFNAVVFMFDFGTIGDGSANSTFLFDDVQLIDQTGGLAQIDLPVTFDDETINYALTDFGGNAYELVKDPMNDANSVVKVLKTTGAETWAGTTVGTALGFATRIPLTATETKMSVMVYSPKAGVHVRLKIEDHKDGTLTAETEAITTVANDWAKLIFDFSTVAEGTNPFNAATSFDKASIFFDFGNVGADDVFYFDDVMFHNSTRITSVENGNALIFGSNDVLKIRHNGNLLNASVNVYDLSGKMVYNSQITNNNMKINMTKKGIYLVHIIDQNRTQLQTQKVLLK